MKEAIIDNGFWYGYDYLLEDNDLKALHKYDEFQRFVQLCKEREKKVKESSTPKMKVFPGRNRFFPTSFYFTWRSRKY